MGHTSTQAPGASPRWDLKPETSPRTLAGGKHRGAWHGGGSQGSVALAAGVQGGAAGGDRRVLAVLCGVQPTQGHCELWLCWGLQKGLPAASSTAGPGRGQHCPDWAGSHKGQGDAGSYPQLGTEMKPFVLPPVMHPVVPARVCSAARVS